MTWQDDWPTARPGQAGRPDLTVREAELAPVRDDADRLTRIATRGGQAAGTTYDAVADLRTAGLSSGEALHHAMWRFGQQSLHLSRDCERIVAHLGASVTSHAGLEAETAAQLGRGAPPRGGNPAIDALAFDRPV